MTVEVLLAGGSALLSLAFSFIPKAGSWFDGLSTLFKRLIMALFVAIWTGIVYGMACAGLLDALNWSVTCDAAGASKLIGLFFAAVGINQAAFWLTPKAVVKRDK